MLRQIIIKINPKRLFIVDGLGALLSAFLLGVVLVKFEHLFGIPTKTLYYLAILSIFLVIFDFFCYRNIKENSDQYLKRIAIMNLVYCFLSIGVAIYHFEIITQFGWIYILQEILIVVILAFIELKTADVMMGKL